MTRETLELLARDLPAVDTRLLAFGAKVYKPDLPSTCALRTNLASIRHYIFTNPFFFFYFLCIRISGSSCIINNAIITFVYRAHNYHKTLVLVRTCFCFVCCKSTTYRYFHSAVDALWIELFSDAKFSHIKGNRSNRNFSIVYRVLNFYRLPSLAKAGHYCENESNPKG